MYKCTNRELRVCILLTASHRFSPSGRKLVCFGWWSVHRLERTQLFHKFSRTYPPKLTNSPTQTNIHTLVHTLRMAWTHPSIKHDIKWGKSWFSTEVNIFQLSRCHIYSQILHLKRSPGLVDHIFFHATFSMSALYFSLASCHFANLFFSLTTFSADSKHKPFSVSLFLTAPRCVLSLLISDRAAGCVLPRLRGCCHSAVTVSVPGCQLAGQRRKHSSHHCCTGR